MWVVQLWICNNQPGRKFVRYAAFNSLNPTLPATHHTRSHARTRTCFGQTFDTVAEDNPGFRYGHGMAKGPQDGELILFGGTTGNLDNSNPLPDESVVENRELISGRFIGVLNAEQDLWLFNADSKKWSRITEVGKDMPMARSFFGFCEGNTDKSYILFGGFRQKRLPELADTWKLSLSGNSGSITGLWQEVDSNGPSPSARVGHVLVSGSDGNIHLFGGGVFDWNKIDKGTQTMLFRAVTPTNEVCFNHFYQFRLITPSYHFCDA